MEPVVDRQQISEIVIPGLRDDFDRLRGRLYELVEACGLRRKQEEAFKRLIRKMCWDAQARLESRLRGKEIDE